MRNSANPSPSTVSEASARVNGPAAEARRTLILAEPAHALHDGYTDAIYVLLPIWRAEFGLDYVALALLRGLCAGAMAAFQVPATRLADRIGGRLLLILGTLLAAAGYAGAGLSGGVLGLYAASNSCKPLVAKASAFLAARDSLHTGVEELAKACSISVGYLSRVFRRETGTSLHNFHVILALRKAKALLRDGEPVVGAALEAGFYDQAHLTREFVRTYGMTPGAFRNAWLAAA